MSGKTIATLYFYVISAGAIVLMVIGIFNTVNFLINSTQYEKYPLKYPQGNCETYPYKFGPYPAMEMVATPSAAELEKQKQSCLEQEDKQSKQQRIDDLKNSITFTLVGLILFLIHFPMARKQS